MRDVIQKVIAAEAEARRIVEAAKTEAGRIASAAQKEAGRQKQELLARAAAEMESQIRFDEATRQRAVEGVIRFVCGEY